MNTFEASNSEQAFQLFSNEAHRAQIVREAIEGTDPLGGGTNPNVPTPALPGSYDGKIPASKEVLEDIVETVKEYEAAMKTLLGHYAAAMANERAHQPQQLQAGGPQNGWQQPAHR